MTWTVWPRCPRRRYGHGDVRHGQFGLDVRGVVTVADIVMESEALCGLELVVNTGSGDT